MIQTEVLFFKKDNCVFTGLSTSALIPLTLTLWRGDGINHIHTQLTLGEGLSRLPSFTMAEEMTNAEVESSDKNILKN